MDTTNDRAVIKSINRQCRQGRIFGRCRYGVDYNTWYATYPQIATTYRQIAEKLAGRKGRFMPREFGYVGW